MKSRVPPSGYDAEPAPGASRPPGMSLGQWLNSKTVRRDDIPGAAEPLPLAEPPLTGGEDIVEIHRRLDRITQQINQLAPRPTAPATAPAAPASANGLANQLNDAISRLDARLSRLSQNAAPRPAPQPHTELPPPPGYAVPPSYAPPPQYAPPQAYAPPQPAAGGYDLSSAIAEINARRGELDGFGRRTASQAPPAPPPMAPATPPSPNLTSLERQLHQITSQIETLRRPDSVDRSIAAFREELAEIRRSLTEALPRRAIDSLETEIRALAQRIDRSREDGGDREMLAGIERALNDIYGVVRTLTPAEQLGGYDAAINKLSDKIDLIVRTSPDSGIEQLQEAIAALRNIVASIASSEAVNRLSEQLHALSDKIDRLAASGGSDALTALEHRIAMLTDAMENRPQAPALDATSLEAAVHALAERIDRLGSTDSSSSMAQIEQRISYLLERLESTEPRFNNSARVEENLGEILRHLEGQREALAGLSASRAEPVGPSIDQGIVDTIRKELIEARDNQIIAERRALDTLETVNGTLSHVVDRLATIEGDLKRVQSAPLQPEMPRRNEIAPAPVELPREMPVAVAPPARPAPRPELPNPVAPRVAEPAPVMPIDTTELRAASNLAEAPQPMRMRPAQRPPIDSTLPPDTPLEPGARGQVRAGATAAERVASNIPPVAAAASDPNSKSNFIAAARRAAQAAAAAAAAEKPSRVTSAVDAARSAAAKVGLNRMPPATSDDAKPSRVRSLLVGASVLVIVLGGFRLAMTYLDGGNVPIAAEKSGASEPPAAPVLAPMPAPEKQKSEDAPPANPLLTSPTAVERQTLIAPTAPAAPLAAAPDSAAPNSAPKAGTPQASSVAPAAPVPPTPVATPAASADVTGSIASVAGSNSGTAASAAPASPAPTNGGADKIPESLAGPALRAAAMRGDASAQFEVAVRYAEGRGSPVNYGEAAKWYERAANGGIVPAMFRLGTILEKGLNGQKDFDAARRYYVLAAERGNAKAMHNIAVLDADGGGRGPNYRSAAVWFRKAAEHGIPDSEYNLGILYARGIGVEQNLAESFKWFSLAAAQGDNDAGRKRDDVAKRLDQQSLEAAKLAIQTFTPEAQPDDAINVATPPGGWDSAAAGKQPAKGAAKPIKQRAASR